MINETLKAFFEAHFAKQLKQVRPLNAGSHHVWHITFQDGTQWVAKQLNKANWLGPLKERTLEWHESLAALVASELEVAVTAQLWGNGHTVARHGSKRVIFMPYCKGRLLNHWSETQLRLLGVTLASIHQLELPQTEARPFPTINTETLSGVFLEKAKECNNSRLKGQSAFVVGHRDIQQGNVIWQARDKLCIIDWDSAGWIHPFVELIGLALNGGGIQQGLFDVGRFSAALTGYREQAGQLPKTDDHLWQQMYHSWLLWLTYNQRMQRMLEVQRTIRSLYHLFRLEKTLQGIYRGWL